MSDHQYTAQIVWHRGQAVFTDNLYSRGHIWRFDGGVEVPASSSPLVVRLPLSVEAAVDPEEAFIASIASCHMLTFLFLAARQGFCVDDYRDDAVGVMSKNQAGRLAVTQVTLRPHAQFSAPQRPSSAQLDQLHHLAHEQCFIANSVTTQIRCEPIYESAANS
jgi:organic hydroperoxide reductase OsmC/OhrA